MHANHSTTLAAAVDPWQPYDNPGKGKGKPVVPEAAAYGFWLIGLTLLILIGHRLRRVRKSSDKA